MGRRAKKRTDREKAVGRRGAATNAVRPQQIAVRASRAMRRKAVSWFIDKRLILRFVIPLGALMLGFNIVFLQWLTRGDLFQTYVKMNAELSGSILQAFGDDATVTGTSISSSRFSIDIKRGCEAVQVSVFFVLAVLLWPRSVPLWRRAAGLGVGTFLLVTINLLRIVSLYYTGIYFPSAFEVMHIDIWQPVFIVLALFFWVVWVWWVSQAPAAEPHAVV